MQSFKDLAVLSNLGKASCGVSELCLLSRVMEAHDVGVLSKVPQNLQIILVNCNGIHIGLFAHAFESNAPFAVINCGHCSPANLFQNFEMAVLHS